MATFLTIGHSNRSADELIGMLRAARVALLIDVRTFPHSRTNPAFNVEIFPDDLARVPIGYRHCPALGGRRGKQPAVDERTNALWRVQSFHNYADYALSEAFAAALAELIALGQEQRLALMCSEAVWWRCHRRIIADHLLMAGHAVTHLMAPGRTEPARLTPGAKEGPNGTVVYPASA